MFVAVSKAFNHQENLFPLARIYKVKQKSPVEFVVMAVNSGLSFSLPSTFMSNFVALNEIFWGLERFSHVGITPEMREKILISTQKLEIMEGDKRTSIQGDLVVSFSDGKMCVRKFIDGQVVIYWHESERVKYDLNTVVFSKLTFSPFTLDTTKDPLEVSGIDVPEQPEEPKIPLVAVSGKRKCLPPCCIQ